MIKLNIDKTFVSITQKQIDVLESEVKNALEMLHKGTGKGSDFLGWLHLPSSITEAEIKDIEKTAAKMRKCWAVVVIGIGGSYLGTKAVVEALNHSFDWLQRKRNNPVLLYAGHNISEDYLSELCETLTNKKFDLCEKYYRLQGEVRSVELLRKGLESLMNEDRQQERQNTRTHGADR